MSGPPPRNKSERSRLVQRKVRHFLQLLPLDRLAATGEGISDAAILGIPGTRRTKKELLKRILDKFFPYGRKTEFSTSGSIRQIVVLSNLRCRT